MKDPLLADADFLWRRSMPPFLLKLNVAAPWAGTHLRPREGSPARAALLITVASVLS
jgi:hypothetical protein